MIIADGRTPDETPQQWRPDLERCHLCLTNQPHSQWAHEAAIEQSYQQEELDGYIKQSRYSIQLDEPVVESGSSDTKSVKVRDNGIASGFTMNQVLAMI